ncbi:hypothetical protein SARC_06675 [Sphaeroforma arctica JP610]|uniref:Thioesterase domain-containing protein n=1 Tax=Sphaeroforma arctica JP610 TaxID=667725 RepID=A0A0L0FWG3_9EUKA|nr:hypothetical protein SARC_06675 [Sphaeroforma arctica JP610]KNC80984.1 hypothetical protein SARC_06675 [Sphaeroforma arctica JP610]|eukprot:XP_014154886.1 hypothetical protein SARC_06675 [Sphaeroforma arctica JP610]
MIKDKQHRPGQSLNLEINRMPALQSVQPGDKVYVRSRPRKVGKSVAFCDLELYRIPTPSSGTVDDSHVDSEREVLATGRHTKYLDMGKAWDVATHPLLISTARKYSQRYFENNQHTPDDKNPSCSVKGGGVDVIGSTWKGLGLQTGSQVNPIEDFLMSYPPGTRKYNATLEVSAATQNPMGNLHGGAAACAAEMAVALAQDAWEQDSTTSAPYTREDLVSMSADFMRPSKGKVLVLVTRLFESPAIEVSFISYKSKDMEPSCKVVCVMGQQGRKD